MSPGAHKWRQNRPLRMMRRPVRLLVCRRSGPPLTSSGIDGSFPDQWRVVAPDQRRSLKRSRVEDALLRPESASGGQLTMVLLGWALLGIALGAAGTEILRSSKPKLVEKVEDAARRFVDSFLPSESADKQDEDEAKNARDDDAS